MDSNLTDRLIQRDEGAFRQLYDLYFIPMTLFAQSYVYDENEAKDIVQELFFKLWDSGLKLQKSASLKIYLLQAVRNRCLNHIRHLKIREAHYEQFLETYLEDDSKEFHPDELIEQQLQEALGELPEKCREIFLMKVIQGKKSKDIADELKLSEGTVKNQVSRAYKKIRSKLPSTSLLLLWIKEMIEFNQNL